MQQMSKDISSKQILLELIYHFFYLIQIKMHILKDLKLEDVIYQKAKSNIITSSSVEKTFMTKELILI